MKKIILVILMFLSFILYCSGSGNQVNEEWVKVKQKSRSYFEKRQLLELDSQMLTELENKDIDPAIEPIVADLLYEIIVYDKLDSQENCFKAFDIMVNKFKNKKHLFNVASEFANTYSSGYPFIIAKIFNSLKKTIVGNYEDNLKALYIVYDSIKTPYIIEAQNGTVKYGANTVVKFLKDYLQEFPKLASAGKIDSDPKKLEMVTRITAEIGM